MSTVAHTPPRSELPMLALTPPALRQAIGILSPARLPELAADLDQATTWAAEQSAFAPLRIFLIKWGTIVAIERIPARAARFHALEHEASTTRTREEARAASAELGAMLSEVQREIGA